MKIANKLINKSIIRWKKVPNGLSKPRESTIWKPENRANDTGEKNKVYNEMLVDFLFIESTSPESKPFLGTLFKLRYCKAPNKSPQAVEAVFQIKPKHKEIIIGIWTCSFVISRLSNTQIFKYQNIDVINTPITNILTGERLENNLSKSNIVGFLFFIMIQNI